MVKELFPLHDGFALKAEMENGNESLEFVLRMARLIQTHREDSVVVGVRTNLLCIPTLTVHRTIIDHLGRFRPDDGCG